MKIVFSVWWNIQCIIYYEMLDNCQTINTDLNCQQLRSSKAALDRKLSSLVTRKEVILQGDNARPHTWRLTKEVLFHLLYSF